MYVSVIIPTPRTKKDYDDILWYVSHKEVSVYVYKGRWHINFDSRCEFLGKNNLCADYENRPSICRRYDQNDCPEEASKKDGKYDFELEFNNRSEFLRFLEENRISVL